MKAITTLRVTVLLLASASAPAQPVERRPSWVSLSTQGAATLDGSAAFLSLGAQIHLPLGSGALRLQGGASYAVELDFAGDGVELAEAHVAVGPGAVLGRGFVSVVAGPSVGWINPITQFGAPLQPFVGLYGGARADVAVLPVVGVGVEVIGNLNTKVQSAGVGFSLTFGRFPRSLIR